MTHFGSGQRCTRHQAEEHFHTFFRGELHAKTGHGVRCFGIEENLVDRRMPRAIGHDVHDLVFYRMRANLTEEEWHAGRVLACAFPSGENVGSMAALMDEERRYVPRGPRIRVAEYEVPSRLDEEDARHLSG